MRCLLPTSPQFLSPDSEPCAPMVQNLERPAGRLRRPKDGSEPLSSSYKPLRFFRSPSSDPSAVCRSPQAIVRRVGTSALILLSTLLLSTYYFLLASPSLAGTDPLDSASPISATVPSISTSDDTTSPTSPILLRPTDGSETGDFTPEFVWRQSTDPNSNTIHYTFYLDNVATYLGVSSDGSSSGTGYTATIDGTEVRLIPTTALSDGTYSWKVVAYDQAGNQASSTSWSLTIDTLAPFLTLTKLDNLDNPLITEESSFEIAGPKAVSFTILTEPYASVRLTLTPICVDGSELSAACSATEGSSEPLSFVLSTNHTGEARFSPQLETGQYSVSISATDHVNLVSVLPTFTLDITTTQILLPGIPPITIPPLLTTLPTTIYNLPATISQVTATPLPLILFFLLVLLALLILFLFLRKSPNLILIDTKGNPIHNALITHSLPAPQFRSLRSHGSELSAARIPQFRPFSGLQRSVRRVGTFATNRDSTYYFLPTTYYKSYIPHLSRFSTLTIRLEHPTSCTITILSLCVTRPSYTIVL